MIIRDFRALVPRVNERILKDGYAHEATDVNIAHRDLRPLPCPETACNAEYTVRTIYPNHICPCLSFPVQSDIAQWTSEYRFLIKMDGGRPMIAAVNQACQDRWCPLGVPCPSSPPAVSTSGSGCDVQYTSFRYRYVNQLGFIGAPSPVTVLEAGSDGTVSVSGFGNPGNCVTNVIIERVAAGYRTGNEGQMSGEVAWHFVASVPIGSGYSGSMSSYDIDRVLGMEQNYPPPDGLRGAVVMKSGAVAGYIGNRVYISEPGMPHAFSRRYDITLDDNIVQLIEHGDEVYALTDGNPVRIVSRQSGGAWWYDWHKIPEYWPCVSRESAVSVGDSIIYCSNHGIVMIVNNSGVMSTDTLLWYDDFKEIHPETARAAAVSGRYFLFTDNISIMFGYGSNYYKDKDAYMVELSIDYPDAVAISTDGKLLYANGGTVMELDFAGDPWGDCCPYTWSTRIIVDKAKTNFGTAKVVFDRPTQDGVTFRYFTKHDGEYRLRYERIVDHSEPFRLPHGFVDLDHMIELSGCEHVVELHLEIEKAHLAEI